MKLKRLTAAIHAGRAKVTIIFENAYHDEPAKMRLCQICSDIGVNWVKTSTGFAASGATVADVQLMRRCSPPQVQVKVSGGIRTLDALLEMRAAGTTRVGSSSTAQTLEECRKRLGLETAVAG